MPGLISYVLKKFLVHKTLMYWYKENEKSFFFSKKLVFMKVLKR